MLNACGAATEEADAEATSAVCHSSMRLPTFVVSNEHVFYPFVHYLENLPRNGEEKIGYVGVGAEQNYTLLAAAGADEVWLYDANSSILGIHAIYRAAFLSLQAASPEQRIEEFLELFGPTYGRFDQATSFIKRHPPPDDSDVSVDELLALYPHVRGEIYDGLRLLQARTDLDDRPYTFMNKAEYFERVRRLYLAGHVHLMHADHYTDPVLARVAREAEANGIRLQVLYQSNAMYIEKVRQSPVYAMGIHAWGHLGFGQAALLSSAAISPEEKARAPYKFLGRPGMQFIEDMPWGYYAIEVESFLDGF